MRFSRIFITLALFTSAAFAQVADLPLYWAFDWDDNIMFMPTKIMIVDEVTGVERAVATDEFALIREKIGKEGEWKKYKLDPATSYRNFREGVDTNHFLTDLTEAVEKGDPEKWKAPAYEAFITSLKTKETAAHVKIITARGHSPEEMFAGIQRLLAYEKKVRGLDLHMPHVENLHGVTWPGLNNGTSASNPSAAKAIIMQDQLREINAKPIDETVPEVRNAAGTKYQKMRLWGFSDDDWGNYEKAYKVIGEDMKNGKYENVKVILRFTGHNNKDHHMETKVITPEGKLRDLQPDEIGDSKEILGELFPKIYARPTLSKSCLESMLALH